MILVGVFPILVLLILLACRLPLKGLVAKASLRMLVQLLMVGLVLNWVFAAGSRTITSLYLVAMTLAGTYIAFERQDDRYPGMFWHLLTAMTISAWSTASASVIVLNGPDALLAPDKMIPMLGIILGNMLNGFVLGFKELASMEGEVKARIETRLTLGADFKEALLPHMKMSLTKALIPITNAMLSAGVVSLPGVLVGQLAAGVDPLKSCLYQMVVLQAILFATTLGIILVFSQAKNVLFKDLKDMTDQRF